MLKKFVEFINEEYELITKMMHAAGKKQENKNIKVPFLQDHAILALADDIEETHDYVELYVDGNNLVLKYSTKDDEKVERFNLASFDNVMELVETAYKAWQVKVHELHLEAEENIIIDELSTL